MGLRTQIQTPLNMALAADEAQASLKVLSAASLVLALLIFFLIALGGLVRNAGAGLSCPDWPLCYGKVVPPMDYQIFLEWFHRLIAGSVSTGLLAISGYIFLKPELRKTLGRYCIAAFVLLMGQIVLGGLTVLGLLNPKWVSSHLAVGLGFFGMILWLALHIQDLGRARTVVQGSILIKAATLVAALVYVQILLGGLVSSNYAGLACPDFPTCNGAWIPPFEGLVRFQFLHRLGAVVLTLSIVAFVIFAKTKMATQKGRLAVMALPALLTAQIFLGVGSIWFKLPLLMSVAHLGTAAALFGMLLVVNYEVRRG